MMTVITHVTIEPGKEAAWDAAFRERVEVVRKQPGWVAVQLCVSAQAANKRTVIGTWETRAAWEAWHTTDVFKRTRSEMEGVQIAERETWWHEVALETHR